jgi:O-antigen ligase
VGFGPGGWRDALVAANVDSQHYLNMFPSSDYLVFWFEGGLVGLALYVALLVLLARAAWRVRSTAPHLFATVVALATIGIADSSLVRIEVLTLVPALLAAMVNEAHEAPQ